MFQKNELSSIRPLLFCLWLLLLPIVASCGNEEKANHEINASVDTIQIHEELVSDQKIVATDDAIKIEVGLISGKIIGEAGEEVRAYLNIPYAEPPVGALRWRPPQPVASWSGIRDCTQYGKSAVQEGSGGPFDFYPQDEDCLYLNVVTPAKHADEKLPVMVFFHGGSFQMGSGNNPLFSHYRLPRQGVIVVSVNMRLGVLGLLAHPLLSAESEHGVSGNYMFLDMIESLKWVQKNIAAFGGDTDNVTIFGESSGGWKVGTLVVSPLAKGLFSRAIFQSGGVGQDRPLSEVEKSGEDYFKMLGVSTLAEARKIPWQEIKERPTNMNYWPAIDGWVIDANPSDLFAAGKQNPVQIMVGLNQGELSMGADAVISDYTRMLSSLRKAGIDGYAYLFDQVPINWKKKGGKAVHALDLFYVFGDYDHKIPNDWNLMYEQEQAFGIGPEDEDPVMTDTDKKVSEEMMAVWAQFAKTGDPSIESLITVPPWDPDSDKYLHIADPLQVKSGFSALAPSDQVNSTSSKSPSSDHGKRESSIDGGDIMAIISSAEEVPMDQKEIDAALAVALQFFETSNLPSPMGEVESRKTISAKGVYISGMPNEPDGNYIKIEFETRFENSGTPLIETVLLTKRYGNWMVAADLIRPLIG